MQIGITFGAFDLLHAGHVLMLKEAKECCDILVVGLHEDPSIERPEKNKPVQSLEERRIQLEGSRYVDRVITYRTEDDLKYILENVKPDIRIIGSDWKDKKFTGWDMAINVYFNSRDHGYSSTELRERIKNS